MNKLWVALLVVLLLAVLLTVGLTVTFVYRKDKSGSGKHAKEIIWTFHIKSGESAESTDSIEKTLNIDIAKAANYEVDGFAATLKSIKHDFKGTKVEGWAHNFSDGLKLTKIVVGSNTITINNVILLAGFTVFNKKNNPDFVTLWHDGKFHHYDTKGKHLAEGAFPFAKGDEDKHPKALDLPKEKDTATPAPEDGEPKPEDGEAKPEEGEAKTDEEGKAEETPEETPEPLPAYEPEILDEDIMEFNLDIGFFATPEQPYVYKHGEREVRVTVVPFGELYNKYTYTPVEKRDFVPHIKFEGKVVRLRREPVTELSVYMSQDFLPLLLTLTAEGELRHDVWVHRGLNSWDKLRSLAVTVGLLDDTLCSIRKLAMFDLSHQIGSYMVGDFVVNVTEVTAFAPRGFPKGFRRFRHTLHRPDGTQAAAMVHKYKFRNLLFAFITKKAYVSAVTATFWEGNLERPLWVKLHVGNAELDYMGYKTYFLVTDSSLLYHELLKANFDHNRVANINLAIHVPYSFDGSKAAEHCEHVLVNTVLETPLPRVRKVVHTLGPADRPLPFHVYSFVGEDLPVDNEPVTSVEAYFLDLFESVPLLVTLRGITGDRHFFSIKVAFERRHLINDSLADTLRHIAYMNHDFLGLDLTKLAPYNHLGSSVIPVGSRVDIMVRQDRDLGLNGFHKYTHEYHKISGSPSHFYLLDLKGADIPLIRGRLLKVEAFMATQQLNPLMVILHADEGIKYYLWKNGRFVEMNKTVMDALEERLRVAAFERFGTTFIDLNATSSYGYKSGEIDYKVDVEQLLDYGAKTRKFIHTFKPTTDIRLTTHTSYFNLSLYPKGPRYNRLIVLKNDLGFPVLLTLLDTENKYHYYRYSGEGKWGRLEQGVEAAKVNLRGDEALLKDPVLMREVPNAPGLRPRVYNTTMYP